MNRHLRPQRNGNVIFGRMDFEEKAPWWKIALAAIAVAVWYVIIARHYHP